MKDDKERKCQSLNLCNRQVKETQEEVMSREISIRALQDRIQTLSTENKKIQMVNKVLVKLNADMAKQLT